MSSPDKKRTRAGSVDASAGYGSRTGRTRRLAFASMFAALALIFSYVEVLIPIPVPIPGVKLGLANLVILIAVYRLGFRYAFTINCVRILIAGLLFNGVFGANVSFGGTSIIIIVGVVLETLKQIESQMLVRYYKGFLND